MPKKEGKEWISFVNYTQKSQASVHPVFHSWSSEVRVWDAALFFKLSVLEQCVTLGGSLSLVEHSPETALLCAAPAEDLGHICL